jgi:hypothetical protein
MADIGLLHAWRGSSMNWWTAPTVTCDMAFFCTSTEILAAGRIWMAILVFLSKVRDPSGSANDQSLPVIRRCHSHYVTESGL